MLSRKYRVVIKYQVALHKRRPVGNDADPNADLQRDKSITITGPGDCVLARRTMTQRKHGSVELLISPMEMARLGTKRTPVRDTLVIAYQRL
jgi:hypothetical protein